MDEPGADTPETAAPFAGSEMGSDSAAGGGTASAARVARESSGLGGPTSTTTATKSARKTSAQAPMGQFLFFMQQTARSG
jgi:hypothetical protein